MGQQTGITWTDSTFNPWVGCTKVSAGCTNCYAETQNAHYQWNRAGWGKGKPRKLTSDDNWGKPAKWNKAAARAGVRRRVFCASLADVFDNEVDQSWRERLWQLIEDTPSLDWLLLTKRPENIKRMYPGRWLQTYAPPANVWIGTTAENQEMADKRIPVLLDVPAVVRFLSIEPMLGPIDLNQSWAAWFDRHGHRTFGENPRFHWVIVGGESGPKCRPMELQWARDVMRQCKDARVAFFMKQLGGHPDKRHNPAEWPQDIALQEFPR